MSNKITLLRAFISGPSDVEPDKEIVKDIIEDLNRSWLRLMGIRIEPFTSADLAPSVASDPQEAINLQIADEYDFLIGILWTRLGTPTPRAASGTVEEIQKAYSLKDQKLTPIDILVYFKNANISSQTDLSQVEKVREFKKQLSDFGFFYKEYSDLDDLRRLFHMNFSSAIATWIESKSNNRKLGPGAYAINYPIWKGFITKEYRKQELIGYEEGVPDFHVIRKTESGTVYDPYSIVDFSNETTLEALSGRAFGHYLDGLMNNWETQRDNVPIEKLYLIVLGPPDWGLTQHFAESVRGTVGHVSKIPIIIFGFIPLLTVALSLVSISINKF